VTNLLIGLLFAVLGLSLMGAFLLQLPSGVMSSLGGARAGYAGALVMGLTFAITAFSCTAPFAGSVLAEAVASGTWNKAVFGMAVYGGTVAAPFFLIAMSPSALKKLPKAGAWMNEFKVVGGIVELAAALKFLAICDYDWHWGIIGRSFTLAVWATAGFLIASYVLGLWRFASDEKVESVALGRLLISGAFLALALWFAAGLFGANLGLIEAFFPGDPAPG
jgi:thiol:disulfide interchange protein